MSVPHSRDNCNLAFNLLGAQPCPCVGDQPATRAIPSSSCIIISAARDPNQREAYASQLMALNWEATKPCYNNHEYQSYVVCRNRPGPCGGSMCHRPAVFLAFSLPLAGSTCFRRVVWLPNLSGAVHLINPKSLVFAPGSRYRQPRVRLESLAL